MSVVPRAAAARCPLARGIDALAGGVGWIDATKTILAADAHLVYENVVGGALPLWSTTSIVAQLLVVARRYDAREILFLGDIVHGSAMSEGAAERVRDALDALRAQCAVTLVAGNHEGRSRAFAVLGETVESCERDGWLLVHGDRPQPFAQRTVIGHLHPSLALGRGKSIPAFLASERLVVVPALTPYSSGLDVLSMDCKAAIAAWGERRSTMAIAAVSNENVYPLGSAATVRAHLSERIGTFSSPRARRALRSDP